MLADLNLRFHLQEDSIKLNIMVLPGFQLCRAGVFG
jgi:hypothetical protein